MKKLKWTETPHCESRAHCPACRTDARFRADVVERYGDFECPLGLPIGHTGEYPERTGCNCGGKPRGDEVKTATPARPSCLECTEKHLGAAWVLLAEWRDGYPHRLRAIGHLHEAEDESQAWPQLHEAIREARKAFQADGAMPDFEALAELAGGFHAEPQP